MSVDDFDICGTSWTIEDHDDFVGDRLQFDFWLSSNDFTVIMVLLFTFSFMGRLIELWYLSALHRIQESNLGRRISASRASVSTVSRSPTMHEATDEIQYENSTAGMEKALHEAAEHDVVVPSWMNYFCLWSWSLFFMTVVFCISLGTIKFNYFIGLLFGCIFDVIFSTSVTIFIYKQRARRKYPGLVFLLFCVWFIVPFNIFMLLGCSYVYEFSRAVALLCTGVSSWFSAGVFYRRWSAVVSPDRRSPGYMCCECHACLGWDAALDEHLPLIRQHDGKENDDDDMLYSPSFNQEPSFTGPPTIRYTRSPPGVALVGHNLSAPQTPTPTHNQLKQMAASTPTSQSTPKSFAVLSNPSPNIIETMNNKIPPSSSSFTSLNSDPPPIFISSTTPPHSRRSSIGALLSSTTTTTTPPSLLSTTSSVPLLPSGIATQTNTNSNPNSVPELLLDLSILAEIPTQPSNGSAVRLDEKHTGLLRSSRSPSSQSASSSSSSSSSFGISISSSHLPSSTSSSSFSAVLPTLPTT